jgi:hypothetical protein
LGTRPSRPSARDEGRKGLRAAFGLVLFLIGQNRLKPAELTPDRTLNSLSRDSRMVKETLT